MPFQHQQLYAKGQYDRNLKLKNIVMQMIINQRVRKNGPSISEMLKVIKSKGKDVHKYIDRIATYYKTDPT
jgi:hypothetical protein